MEIPPCLTEALKHFVPFRVLDTEYLEGSPESHFLQDLWEGEVEQIREWRAQRMGEVIFNDWD